MKDSELAAFVAGVTAGAKLIVVSNREPCLHEHVADGIRMVRPASGMVTAIEPIIKAVGGTWVAHGSGTADRLVVDRRGRLGLPPEAPRYTLRRVWLSRKEEEGYYYGLANRALWPLCHTVYTRPYFSRAEWETYRSVNEKFRDAVLEEAEGGAVIVFIQDYHLALLPRLLKDVRPDLKILHFWHIPWPNPEAFRIFPWGEELIDGLLGNDLLGFHIQYHCNNFLDTVDRFIEARVDLEHFRVFRGGRPTWVRPFPISVDASQISRDAEGETVGRRLAGFLKELGEEHGKLSLFVGADRIDYTKGIPERLRGFDLMLQRHPELVGKVCFVQLAAPSRTHVEAYRHLNEQIDALVDEINWRHQTDDWTPVFFLRAHHDYYAVLAAYRMAQAVVVSSLHDGMNLVAKEFVAARNDGDGVLLLSRYTGAARELGDALLINPFDGDGLADAMYRACVMPEAERRERMERLRSQVERNTVYDWGLNVFAELERLLGQEENG